MIDLRLGDCLEIMPTLPAQSFDAIIADIPYGTTACSWDTVIPFAPMWEQLKRLAKPRAAIVLFGSQPFTSALVMSNADWFKYSWVWEKTRPFGLFNSKNRPLIAHEDIAVFSNAFVASGHRERMNYNPQGLQKIDMKWKRPRQYESEHRTARPSHKLERVIEFGNYPRTVIRFANSNNAREHPTQKPVALMEYLIRTYTNEGDTVLDFTMGSGTTMVAAVNTNRNGVGIELREDYYNIAQRRIAEAQAQMTLAL